MQNLKRSIQFNGGQNHKNDLKVSSQNRLSLPEGGSVHPEDPLFSILKPQLSLQCVLALLQIKQINKKSAIKHVCAKCMYTYTQEACYCTHTVHAAIIFVIMQKAKAKSEHQVQS